MSSREEIISQMSKREITKQLVISQLFLFSLAILISGVFLDFSSHWVNQWGFDYRKALLYGLAPAAFIIGIDFLLMKTLPEKYFDDGGINKKVFENQSVFMVVLMSAMVAISEEVLFRGVLQPILGYVGASLLFAFVHIRYVKKPVLFISVVYISFLLGFIYEQTQVLTYVILAHFLVDVTMGFIARSES
ncbi:CPBP family intramembrane glutamic endopeptidase [Salimicrobium flavidum]|uniref:CAAX prenyl protease 2/Lysostaphin resistance protein A-like domain-containing protein n=1 Tax=Salimicrobium flavidum TaxID=570947 RepID=A0A1N7IJ05_9BACI|nr:CPBP family intramembrane glutamic endopeptidase [Salimicrobium flavidum]SIS37075.1 hypothetical protein SAMN05421687_101214 [Salimicrobium flavidum]